MKALIVVLVSLVPVAASAHGPGDRAESARAAGTWVCNAYGHGGPRNVWQSVTGAREHSRAAAEQSARAECQHRQLNACGNAGCWPD